MSKDNSESLMKRIDQLIKKNNELEKKVFNLVHNPEENSSKSFISKKEKELKNLQSIIKKKQSEIQQKENRLNMKELELNQKEMLLNKKELALIEKEKELSKQKPKVKYIVKEPVNKQKKIEDICSHILNSKSISPKKLYEDMTVFGTILKKEIEEELKSNPDKFVQIDNVINNEDQQFLPSAILAKSLQQNKILAVVEKDSKESKIYDIALQFLVNGMASEQKMVISYDFGKEQNDLIIYDEDEQKKFVEKELDKLSQALQVPKEYINICNFREGSCKYDVNISEKIAKELIDDYQKENQVKKPFVDPFLNIDDNFENLVNKLKKMSTTNNIHISQAPLVEAIKLNTSLFDPRGNRSSGWPVGEKRGGMEYEAPIGWIGHGLRVSQKYDNGDDTWLGMDNSPGEWCVAYHGTSIQFAKAILETNLKAGKAQVHELCDNVNPRCNLKKVGIGIYVTPRVYIAESYSDYKNEKQKYKCIFMCRINPTKFRTCEDSNKEYWVVEPSEEDIRPYRLLIKKVEGEEEKEEEQ
jgi:hypothetical protein